MLRTTAVILAGGVSRRMGEDKRRLRLFPVSPTFLNRTIAIGRLVCDRVAVVGEPGATAGRRDVIALLDRWPSQGPLGGLVTALDLFPEDRLLLMACDYPMLQVDLLRRLLDRLEGHDASLPTTGGTDHPLVGWYDAARCRPFAGRAFEDGARSMAALLGGLDASRLRVEPDGVPGTDHLSLTNVNGADDLALLRLGAIERDSRPYHPAP